MGKTMYDFMCGYFTALQHIGTISMSSLQTQDYISIFSALMTLISTFGLIYIGYRSYVTSREALKISSSASETAQQSYVLGVASHIQNQKSTLLVLGIETFKKASDFAILYNNQLAELSDKLDYFSSLDFDDELKQQMIQEGLRDAKLKVEDFVAAHQSSMHKPIEIATKAIDDLVACTDLGAIDASMTKILAVEISVHKNILDCDRLIKSAKEALQSLDHVERTII